MERIREHFPEENIRPDRPGRRPVPTRQVLEAVLWILNTGAQWHMLPQCYPNYKTVHRRFQQWCEREILRAILVELANELRERGEIDESECFIDATFASAKAVVLSVSMHAANHHEVTLVQLSFDFYMIEAKPENLIAIRRTTAMHWTSRIESAVTWLRTKGRELKAQGQPWFMAVNLVNPHDIMFVNSDAPGETVQGKGSAYPIDRPPRNETYLAE